MNIADTEIVRAVLQAPPLNLQPALQLDNADIILINTCAIREQAEDKSIQRIKYFQSLRKARVDNAPSRAMKLPIIGVLGCMAERLKAHLLQDVKVDFIAGPDSYRELSTILLPLCSPHIPSISPLSKQPLDRSIAKSVSDERYEGIIPVRETSDKANRIHAFVTVQRGCDNHCAFCIVPYTRGRERSVPVSTIVQQVRKVIDEDSVKEIVLLGQNVNLYYDDSCMTEATRESSAVREESMSIMVPNDDVTVASPLSFGFTRRSKFRRQKLGGVDFATLLRTVAAIDRNVRIRFQSPHPQAFPDDLLRAIRDEPNLCKSLHMPAQHGASSMLQRMERGYDIDAYRHLIAKARRILSPNHPDSGIDVGISTDMLVGFCGETEAEHAATIELLQNVMFDQAFQYAYSARLQTPAMMPGRRRQSDDVPPAIKQARLQQAIETFQRTVQLRNALWETGRLHVILLEGDDDIKNTPSIYAPSEESEERAHDTIARKTTASTFKKPRTVTGRTDSNKRVIVPVTDSTTGLDFTILDGTPVDQLGVEHRNANLHDVQALLSEVRSLRISSPSSSPINDLARRLQDILRTHVANPNRDKSTSPLFPLPRRLRKGDYLVVKIVAAHGHTLRGLPVMRTTLLQAHALLRPDLPSHV